MFSFFFSLSSISVCNSHAIGFFFHRNRNAMQLQAFWCLDSTLTVEWRTKKQQRKHNGILVKFVFKSNCFATNNTQF